MERWPDFFIVGAARSGTTSLYAYLKEIPGIHMSLPKEPRYFNSAEFQNLYNESIRDKEKYLKIFQGIKQQISIGEASTSYLRDPKSPDLIHQIVPTARIIIILRDPVERAFSHYLLYIREKKIMLSFHEVIRMSPDSYQKYPFIQDVLESGLYSQQVKRYLEVFGSERVKVLIFEEFTKHTKEKVEEVLEFLGINYSINDFKGDVYNEFTIDRIPLSFTNIFILNPTIKKMIEHLVPLPIRRFLIKKIFTKETSKPQITEEDKVFLQNLYHDDVKKLRDVLKRQLPWHNFRKS